LTVVTKLLATGLSGPTWILRYIHLGGIMSVSHSLGGCIIFTDTVVVCLQNYRYGAQWYGGTQRQCGADKIASGYFDFTHLLNSFFLSSGR
jgi:hypothetical protein